MGISVQDGVTAGLAAYAAVLSTWVFYVMRREKSRERARQEESKKEELNLRVVGPGRFKVTSGSGDRAGDAMLLIHLQADIMNRRSMETTITIKSVSLASVEIIEEQSSMWLGVPRRPVMDRNVTVGAAGAHPFTITLTLMTRQPASDVSDQITGSILFQDSFAGELPPIEFAAEKNRT